MENIQIDNNATYTSEKGKKGYSVKKMSCLVYYSFMRGFTKASIIADLAENHTYFKYVANGITPD